MKANKDLGINLALLKEAHQAGLSLKRGIPGANVMYFETGPGRAALSGVVHFGVDHRAAGGLFASNGHDERMWVSVVACPRNHDIPRPDTPVYATVRLP
jgi:hypothetical protein